MDPFTQHRGILATLNRANVDTDQIIPKQFLKSIKRTGFGPALFFDWRYQANGDLDPDFELNQARFQGRSILVTRNNFGCGSSREHAVWALAQDGYRVVIAPAREVDGSSIPGFADIFKNNCVKNGVVTIELSEDQVEAIFSAVEAQPGLEATVDLDALTLTLHRAEGDQVIAFRYDDSARHKLLRGLDDISETLVHEAAISRFEAGHETQLAHG